MPYIVYGKQAIYSASEEEVLSNGQSTCFMNNISFSWDCEGVESKEDLQYFAQYVLIKI